MEKAWKIYNFKIMNPVVLDYNINNEQKTIEHNFIKQFIQLHVSTPWGHNPYCE
jgi:hypothetical protein